MRPEGYWQLRRRGFDLMSLIEMQVLKHLLQAKRDGWEFIPLAVVHGNTLKALFLKDWIFTSGGPEGNIHKITARGEKALQVYRAPSIKRTDNMCPRCCENPRPLARWITRFATGAVKNVLSMTMNAMFAGDYRDTMERAQNPRMRQHSAPKTNAFTANWQA